MIRIRQVRLPITSNNISLKVAKLLHISSNDIKSIKIVKKSLDARDKKNLLFVYELDVDVIDEEIVLRKNKSKDIFLSNEEEYKFVLDKRISFDKKVVIVGAGPAGLYCAYMLALYGFKPLVIERGEKVEERVKTVSSFFSSGKLNTSSNVQFGEGGAGTFSDGKLNTSVKDPLNRIKKVLEIFVECGASPEILYEAMPHIGTDVLCDVVKNMRDKIISNGGEFRYNTTMTDLVIKNNKITGIIVNDREEIPTDYLVLAIGHSARDTFELLYRKGFSMTSKSFAVGVRVEHPQKMINLSQYGIDDSEILSPASYKLTYTTKSGRGVYSFCMCPGGYVVNASSEEGRLCVNGMSNYKRESKNANSAIVVTVNPRDFGEGVLDGVNFQRILEEKAYMIGRGLIPVQKYIDFKNNRKTTKLGSVEPITKGDYTFANLNDIFPEYINSSIVEGMDAFSSKIKEFNRDDALLFGVEARTSSPVRIIRDDNFLSNVLGVYPCGEGCGYAGGITTAAIDGIKVAEKIALTVKE